MIRLADVTPPRRMDSTVTHSAEMLFLGGEISLVYEHMLAKARRFPYHLRGTTLNCGGNSWTVCGSLGLRG